MATQDDNLGLSILSTVGRESLAEISIDAAQVTVDSILKNDLLSGIPVFGILYKSFKTVFSIRESLFAKKVYDFVFEIKDVSSKERNAFIKDLEEQEGSKQRAGETLLMLIDRLDHLEKPKIIGRLAKAKMNGKLSLSDFLRLSSIVDKVFLYDLKHLQNYESSNSEEFISDHLATLGLLFLVREGGTWFNHEKNIPAKEPSFYVLSDLGRKMLKYGISTA